MSTDETNTTLVIEDSIDAVTRKGGPHLVDFIIMQLNDVYEAPPVEGGRLGGLARAATLRKQLAKENPNLLTLMIGDFLAPSPIGATTGDAGQHMIESLNALGLTHCTIGNHEFDVGEADLVERIAESRFEWIISNVTNGRGELFRGTKKNAIVEFANKAGNKARVALIGVCLDLVKKPWIKYHSPIEAAKEQVAELGDKADIFVAMTHLTIEEDQQLGTSVPRLDVLMGGHEHEAASAIVGDDATPIYKADSNARSAFVHRFRFNTKTRVAHLFTELVPIDKRFEEDPETDAIVKKWQKITFDSLRAQGNEPTEIVGYANETLEGYEAQVRSQPTNLTRLILDTLLAEVPDADLAMFPAGNIRIDGIIPPGDITYWDIVRIFPTGGRCSVLSMPGSLVSTWFVLGEQGKGKGNYLHYANVSRADDGTWLVKGEPVVADRMYTVVFPETPVSVFSFPPFKGTGTTKVFDTREVRLMMKERFLKTLKPKGRKKTTKKSA